MNPIRREVLNGLFVLVISTLLSAAIADKTWIATLDSVYGTGHAPVVPTNR